VKTALVTGIVGICVWLAVSAVLYFLQNKLIYHPVPEVERPGAQVVRIRCGSASVKVWVLHDNLEPAVIYFGGNGEEVSASLPAFDALMPGRAIYLASYRGYSGSTGEPSEDAISQDALSIHDWVATRHKHIAVIGRSLGSGVAAILAASRPIERLVLVTPFDSLTNVAADRFPWLPVRWLLTDQYDSVHRIAQVHAPILVLIAGDDGIIGRARTDALIAAIPASMRHTELIRGAGHNDIQLFSAYQESLRRFLAP
jgi:fermentation-respiration switch protein FrsA (DUF1100 family)